MTDKKNEIVKNEKRVLKTTGDRYIDTLSKEAEIVMNSMGLELKPEVKNALFNLGLACEKTIKDKNITWDQVNKDGLPSKLLYYAQLNLNPANNELYIIPYKNGSQYILNFEESYLGKKKKVKKFSIDGLEDAIAFVVKEGDIYEPDIDLINGDKLVYKPEPFNNGDVKGAVCYLKYIDHTKNRIVEMSLSDLEKVKEASKSKMGGKLSPSWTKWENEMYKKAVLKRAVKEIEIEVPSEYQEAYVSSETIDNANYNVELEDRKTVIVEANFEEKQEDEVLPVEVQNDTQVPEFI